MSRKLVGLPSLSVCVGRRATQEIPPPRRCSLKFLVIAAAVILAIGALGLWGHPFDISLKEGAACALGAACLLTLARL